MSLPSENMLESALTNAEFTAKLMNGDAGARSLFNSLTRQSLGMPPEPPPPSAAEMLTSPDTGANVDLFAPDAESKLPLIGWSSGPHGMTDRLRLNDINGWREQGYTDLQIAEMHDEGRAYPQQIHDATRAIVAGWQRDIEFQRRLFSGDPQAAVQVNAAARILSGGVKG